MNFTCENSNHNKSQIMMVCLNGFCQSQSKFLCEECIKQDLHFGHNKDFITIQKLPDFFTEKSQNCESFITSLQKQLDQTQELLNKIKFGLRQKYQLDEGRLKNLKQQQVNQAIIEIIKYKDQKNLIEQELFGGIINLNQVLNNTYSSLELDLLSYRNISDQDKDQAKKLYKEGYNLYWNDDKYQEAIEKLDQSLALNPYDQDTLWCKGECLKMLDKYNEVLLWLDKALEIDQKHFNSLSSKGDCLRLLKKYNEALPWLDKALEIDQKHVNSLFSKGECLKMLDKYNEALPWFDKALEIDSKDVCSLSSKGDCLRMLDKFDEALPWLDKALEIDSKHVNSLSSKGDCLRMLNKQNEALTWLDKALIINPNHKLSLGSKAHILKEQKNFKEAIIFYDKALAINPTWNPYINGKKYCLEQLGLQK